MTDLRSATTILEVSGTEAGAPLHKALEGDAIAAKNAHGALIAKNGAGNFKYLLVDDNGAVVMTSETAATMAHLSANGKVVGSGSFVSIATITLTPDLEYENIGFVVGCYRDAEFRIIHLNNVTPIVLAQGFLVGAGSLSLTETLKNLKFTAGSTGAQELTIQGLNQNALSDLRATVTVDERL